MSNKVKSDIKSRIRKIERNKFTSDDIRLLFIDLRDYYLITIGKKAYENPLMDILDFCAHNIKKDRGLVFEYSKKIIDDFVNSIKVGGSVPVTLVDLNIEKSINDILTTLDIDYDKKKFKKRVKKISKHIFFILKDVKLDIKHTDVESCSIVYDKKLKTPYISFKLKPFKYTHANGSTIAGSPTMRFRIM